MATREQQIIRTAVLNILANLMLSTVKFVLGSATHSIAITLDGVNSLTDSLSSALTIGGTKLAQRPASRAHPFGHGRFEYLTSIVVAAIIVAAGVSSLNSSIMSILKGGSPAYTVISLVVVGIASGTKAAMGIYTRAMGKKLNSSPLVANGTDSCMDAWISASTLVAGVVNVVFHIGIESYLAAGISVLIVKSGVEILADTVSKILGERQDPELVTRVEKAARSVEGVRFASGVVLTDFGPNNCGGSLHVTVDKDMTVAEFDAIAREVYQRVMDECGVWLVSVGVYPAEEIDDAVRVARAKVSRALWSHEHVAEVRGLFVDAERKVCRFDAVADFSINDIPAFEEELRLACKEALPEFTFDSRVRRDVGD